MLRKSILLVLLGFSGTLAAADVPPLRDPTRGELLYSTHCIACHSTEIHWRDKKVVTNWPTLYAEVRRWQGLSALGWGDDDIAEVARYLNGLHYHYPAPD